MIIYLGQAPATDSLKPWKHFKVRGVMVSAYEFMMNRNYKEICISRGIHDLLDFDGQVMLDSGGYQKLRGHEVDYSPYELANFVKESGADAAISLDFPPRSPRQNFVKLAEKNFRNYLLMNAIIDNVLPTVHAPLRLADLELAKLVKVCPKYIAVGGLVPNLRSTIKETLNTVIYTAYAADSAKIHLLGFGGPNHLRKISKLVYSLDYCGWRGAAAFGYILLPNGYRKITRFNKNGHAPYPSIEERKIILRVCDILSLKINNLLRNFDDRALFNAYVINSMCHKPLKRKVNN